MIVSLVGLLAGLFAILIAFPDSNRRKPGIYLGLFTLHLAMAIAYWGYTYESGMDAYMYYQDPFGLRYKPFATNTVMIAQFVQASRDLLGGSYLDYFFLFQAFGMIGIAFLIRTFQEIADSLSMEVPMVAYLLLFLPGLHFWSVAIGKDAPMFMAISMATWASLKIHRRALWFIVALVFMTLIRSHIAAMALFSMLVALLLNRELSTAARTGLLIAGATIFAIVLTEAKLSLQLDTLDVRTISDFVDRNQGYGETHGADNLESLPFPFKVLTLLFRPLFFDAPGFMGFVISFENVFFLYIFGYIALSWRTVIGLIRPVYYLGFCLLFAFVVIIALAAVSYNIGLGQRQKMMAMPPVLVVFVTVFLYRRYTAARERGQKVATSEGRTRTT